MLLDMVIFYISNILDQKHRQRREIVELSHQKSLSLAYRWLGKVQPGNCPLLVKVENFVQNICP
jgi:hypothetical protein